MRGLLGGVDELHAGGVVGSFLEGYVIDGDEDLEGGVDVELKGVTTDS